MQDIGALVRIIIFDEAVMASLGCQHEVSKLLMPLITEAYPHGDTLYEEGFSYGNKFLSNLLDTHWKIRTFVSSN